MTPGRLISSQVDMVDLIVFLPSPLTCRVSLTKSIVVIAAEMAIAETTMLGSA